VSQRQSALRMSGPRADALLNTGCPLDLSLARFPVGMCTRTLLGKAEVVLWRTDAAEFHLEVARSFQDYVAGLLREAGRSA
jgi:sarcosine oxidase, subunit gamma